MSQSDSNHQLYHELVRTLAAPLYRFAHRLCGSADTAEDLVQETFCEAWKSIESLREPERGRAWIFRILRRRFAQSIRRKATSVPLASEEVAIEGLAGDTGPDVLALLSQQELLCRAIDELNERFRQSFLLMFVDGLSCAEIADTLGLPLGTVLSRIHRARIFLRARLRELDADGATESTSRLNADRTKKSNA